MSAPPWGHKPPAVDPYEWWMDRPPAASPRLAYWLRRLREGSWWPNRRLSCEGYDGSAHMLGVYMWEYLHVLGPVLIECGDRTSRGESRETVRADLVGQGKL